MIDPPSAPGGTRIFLLRHGESLANVQRLIASSPAAALDAFGLTETGREQVRRSVAAARAADLLSAGGHLISSPLLRARESAAIVAALLSTSVEVDERLTERGFGEWELASDHHYELVWAADQADPTHERWGVESVAALHGRASTLIRELHGRGDGDTYVLCTHGDVASVLLCAAGGQALGAHRSVGALANGELRMLGDSPPEGLSRSARHP